MITGFVSFLISQFKHYKDHVNNINVSGLDCELFDSYTTRTPVCLAQFSSPTKHACHLLARPPSITGLAGNALSSVSTTRAFPAVNTTNQASSLKLNFALGSSPITEEFSFQDVQNSSFWVHKDLHEFLLLSSYLQIS